MTAKKRYGTLAAKVDPTPTSWEELNSKIRDIAVDFTYHLGSIFDSQLPQVAVSIESRAGVLRVSSSEVDPTPLGLGFRGAHAEIDGLEFPLSSKVK